MSRSSNAITGIWAADTETSGLVDRGVFLGQLLSYDAWRMGLLGNGSLNEEQPEGMNRLPFYVLPNPRQGLSLGAFNVNGLSTDVIASKENCVTAYVGAMQLMASIRALKAQNYGLLFYNGGKFDGPVLRTFLEENLLDGRFFSIHPSAPPMADLMHIYSIMQHVHGDSLPPVLGKKGLPSRSLMNAFTSAGGIGDETQAHDVTYDTRVLSAGLFRKLWDIDPDLMSAILACSKKTDVLKRLRTPNDEPIFVMNPAGALVDAAWTLRIPLPEGSSTFGGPWHEKNMICLLRINSQTDVDMLRAASPEILAKLISVTGHAAKQLSPFMVVDIRQHNVFLNRANAEKFGMPPFDDSELAALQVLISDTKFIKNINLAMGLVHNYPPDPNHVKIDWRKRDRLRTQFHASPWEEREALAMLMDPIDQIRALTIIFMNNPDVLSANGASMVPIAPIEPLIAECEAYLTANGRSTEDRASVEAFLASETRAHALHIALRDRLTSTASRGLVVRTTSSTISKAFVP